LITEFIQFGLRLQPLLNIGEAAFLLGNKRDKSIITSNYNHYTSKLIDGQRMEIPTLKIDRTTELLAKNSAKTPIQTPNLDNLTFCNLLGISLLLKERF